MVNNSKEKNTIRKKHKKSRKKISLGKKVLITLSLVLLFVISVAGGLVAYSYDLLDKMEQVDLNKEDLSLNTYVSNDKIENIALFGVDGMNGEGGRSDSILILTIDKVNNKLKVSSIMRDAYVSIPGHGKDKITHAYAYGGPQLAIKTLNENFNLDIQEFLTVNFESFPQIIDALGGLDIEITQEEIDASININSHIRHLNELNGTNSPYINTPGLQHLDGTQSLAYARIRYTDGGDAARTQRQQVVLNALIDKLKETPVTQYNALLNKFLPLIKTSLTSNEMLGVAGDVLKLSGSPVEDKTFPCVEDTTDSMIGGIYYLTFNRENTIDKIHEFIYGTTNSEAQTSSN